MCPVIILFQVLAQATVLQIKVQWLQDQVIQLLFQVQEVTLVLILHQAVEKILQFIVDR